MKNTHKRISGERGGGFYWSIKTGFDRDKCFFKRILYILIKIRHLFKYFLSLIHSTYYIIFPPLSVTLNPTSTSLLFDLSFEGMDILLYELVYKTSREGQDDEKYQLLK